MKTKAIFLSILLAIALTEYIKCPDRGSEKGYEQKVDRKIDSAIIKSEQDKAKEKEQADKNQATVLHQRITVLKQQVAEYLGQKLTTNTMMSINSQAGYILRWKHTIKKR